MPDVVQVRFCGFGGQGIVLMGVILGEAAVRDGFWAAGSNSYGAQARGSACRSEVVISNRHVDFPHVLQADLLGAMSQGAYGHFVADVRPGGLVLCDDTTVTPSTESELRHIPIAATAGAVKELKNVQVANMVMLAATVSLSGVVSRDALLKAMEGSVSSRFHEINTRAMEMGFALAEAASCELKDAGQPIADLRLRV